MFGKLNVNYSKKENNSKKNIILNELKIKNENKTNDKLSIKNTLNLSNKVDNKKKENFNKTFISINKKENDNIRETSLPTQLPLIFSPLNSNILISSPIKMKMVEDFIQVNIPNISSISLQTPEQINMYIINMIKSSGIKTINNVYQPIYKDDVKSTGLGDFIRGSYFLMEFCSKYDLNYKIVFNNKMSLFLKNKDNRDLNNITNNIKSFKDNNVVSLLISNEDYVLNPIKNKDILSIFTKYLKDCISCNKTDMFIYCTCFPINETISENDKIIMQKILEPTNTLKIEVNNILKVQSLKPKNYTTIHIRSGDNYLNDNSNTAFKKSYIVNLIENIRFSSNDKENLFLICDNNNIKNILLNILPNLKCIFREIIHLSISDINVENENKIKNTLIEFYLLSFSKEIISFSCYKHGSGFSYWCAKTFNIPYSCKYISTN
jgi:hypothetical protein